MSESTETVRVYVHEPRCGVFELDEAPGGAESWTEVYEVPRPLWEELVSDDEEAKAATERNHRSTLAVVQHIVSNNPDAEEALVEWAELGMEAFK